MSDQDSQLAELKDQNRVLQGKVDQLEKRLSPQNADDPFGPTWSPTTAQDMGRDILKAVESKFPNMVQSQQEQLVDTVLKKLDERNKASLAQQKAQEDQSLKTQLDTIKQLDPDFNDKKMWEWLKGVANPPATVIEAYQRFKQEYKEPDKVEEIKQDQPKGPGIEAKPAVSANLDQALQDAYNDLGINNEAV